ncbi:MAG: efflux RND transporter periplasmic adaptor subunit [Candidatus Niyogibacteria bacterium]|nr:efflux RND transporter periplasmic adaptor subunit [Candidatus Niyogibacteria bacterium]
MKYFKMLRRKSVYIPSIAAAAVIIGAYFYFFGSAEPEYVTATAIRGDLAQIVSVTGRVKPAESVNLAFEKGGRIAWKNAEVGNKVFIGQILVQLENRDIAAQLKAEEAKLAELVSGSREEDISIQRLKVENAEALQKDAENSAADDSHDAFTKSDDAVRNKVDQFISNPTSSSPQINFAVADINLESDIEWERIGLEAALDSWKDSLDKLTASSDVSAYLSEAKTNLNRLKTFLDKVSLAVNALTANSSLSQTTIDGYRAGVLTARTNINTAIANMTAADEKLRSARSSLDLEKEELALLLAGTRPEKILAQEASVDNYRAQLAKTIIRAPINGTVTVQNAKIGEIVGAGASVVSLISEANFEIEANVPEADVAKIHLGDKAQVTLDAYGSGILFEASVSAIDPAETVVEGVAIYKTTLQFANKDERIKSGMTANLDILAAKADGVIIIPQRAVVTEGGSKKARIVKNGSVSETEVKTGLRGSDGNVEITEGLAEGDEVVIFTKE